MDLSSTLRATTITAATALALLGVPAAATAEAPPDTVDQSKLQPTLNESFAPWTCKAKQTGPVCTGERHLSTAWELTDFPCAVPIYGRTDSSRRSTRYYNWDYLNYDRFVHLDDVDRLSTEPTGPASATITATTRFREVFSVPGDPTTITVVTEGVPWDIRSAQGSSVWRAVGTLVEPPGVVGTFTGQVTDHGVTTRFENAPLTDVLPDEKFLQLVCEAATGTR